MFFSVDEMHSGSKCKNCHREYMRLYHQKWLKKVKDVPGTSKCRHCDTFKLNKDMKYKTVCNECYNHQQKVYNATRREDPDAEPKQGVRQERSDGGTV